MMVSYSVKKKVGKRNAKFRRSGTLNLGRFLFCILISCTLSSGSCAAALDHEEYFSTYFLSSFSYLA